MGGAAAGGLLAAYFTPWRALFSATARPSGGPPAGLRPDPDGILDLPPGFTYEVLERFGAKMDDGYRVPGLPDGMACFRQESGDLVLMRNHEVDRRAIFGIGLQQPAEAYDRSAFGGVTRVLLDPNGRRRRSNLVLTGTLRNCAGGPSPWGWLSCEETTAAGHGYVFACSTDADRVQPARRIPGYGRFKHEAVAVDPSTYVAYLTEDQGDGALYRFVPSSKDSPWSGELQALRVVGRPRLDTGTALSVGEVVEVDWVAIDEPDPPDDTVRRRAQSRGAAIVRRGEGIAFHQGTVYVCSTSGGPKSRGQIFRLTSSEEGGSVDRLELVAQAQDDNDLDMPDNITVAPWGDVYMAEDGGGEQLLRALTPDGRIVDVARNAQSQGELAGVCFAPRRPDAQAGAEDLLFVNLQLDGLTLAVRGPFEELTRAAAG